MKIQEIVLGQEYKDITGTLQQAMPPQTETFGDGKQVPAQMLVVDGVTGKFWCGQNPLTAADCNKEITLQCKASTYQNQMQYTLKRPASGKGGRGYGGKSQQEIDETRRSIAFSYLVDKQKLGFDFEAGTFLKANVLEKWIKDGVMPVTYGPPADAGNYSQPPAESDEEPPF